MPKDFEQEPASCRHGRKVKDDLYFPTTPSRWLVRDLRHCDEDLDLERVLGRKVGRLRDLEQVTSQMG